MASSSSSLMDWSDLKYAIEKTQEKLNVNTSRITLYITARSSRIPQEEQLKCKLDQIRSQFEEVAKQLKSEGVWQVLQKKFSNSATMFTEISVIKPLMTFADSVCKILINSVAVGTGFVLFHIPAANPESPNSQTHRRSFILTNAHVIMAAVEPSGEKLFDGTTFTAEFEEWTDGERTPRTICLKKKPVAYQYNPGEYMDFALLELEENKEWTVPEGLLTNYKPNSPDGGIFIIGHPDGEDKKISPSFIVEHQKKPNSPMPYIIQNKNVLPFLLKGNVKSEWNTHKQRINYRSCFVHGSSGSPVFDSKFNLIGIHCGGYSYRAHAEEKISIVEYAYPMNLILRRFGETDAVADYIRTFLAEE